VFVDNFILHLGYTHPLGIALNLIV